LLETFCFFLPFSFDYLPFDKRSQFFSLKFGSKKNLLFFDHFFF
jgi:hypothetical protein